MSDFFQSDLFRDATTVVIIGSTILFTCAINYFVIKTIVNKCKKDEIVIVRTIVHKNDAEMYEV